jgi:hypothetical protein
MKTALSNDVAYGEWKCGALLRFSEYNELFSQCARFARTFYCSFAQDFRSHFR